ncbi:MFS transporter [Haloparvum sp. PAK95]|uniref:MFS transporter n=1 Tax=Haloparvum sp. PAK95 TaxID=3418962 RepID=UPI003D2ED231
MRERWLPAWALGSVAFGGASLLVPLYIVLLGATPVQLGLLAGASALIGAPGAIAFGRLADQVGHRRTLVLLTLATVAATLAAIPFLTSILAIVVANTVLWLFVASVAPVTTMLVVDDAAPEEWPDRIGRFNEYQGYGWAGGLVLGTVWPLVGSAFLGPVPVVRVLFWLLAGCAALSVLGAARSLPRPAPGDHVTSERQVARVGRLLSRTSRGVTGATFVFFPNRLYWTTQQFDLARLRDRLDPTLATFLLAAGLFFTGFAAFWAPLPLLLTEIGFASGSVFALYLGASLASAVLYEPVGALASRYDVRRLLAGTLAVRGVCFPLVPLLAGLGSVALGFVAVGVGLAVIGATWAVVAVVGTVVVTRIASPAARGEVLGAYTALTAVAGGVGGVLGGWLASFGYRVAFAVAGGFVVAGAGLVVALRSISGPERAPREPADTTGSESESSTAESPPAERADS